MNPIIDLTTGKFWNNAISLSMSKPKKHSIKYLPINLAIYGMKYIKTKSNTNN